MPEFDGNCDFDIVKYFLKLLEDDDLSSGIAAIETLLMILEKKQFDTIHILQNTMQEAVMAMRNADLSIAAVISGGELFCRFITLSLDDRGSMEECREIMLHRGQIFLAKLQKSRHVIAQQAQKFITDGCRVLVHSRSRVVLKALLTAAKANKQFHVYITQGGPDKMGEQMMNEMESAGIDCTLILDAAIGYVMESVDFVMVGAEAVVESGGIVNRVGTFTMALCAREMKKPFYVLAESFKFTRLYPLNQRDLPDEYKYARKDLNDVSKVHPSVDYTPPAYITLLFTDLGILTPSAVSDELIKLYM
ncbi:eukaryotic translation initiation factor 2B subunit alpha [Glossina fuscipes fuscipes]